MKPPYGEALGKKVRDLSALSFMAISLAGALPAATPAESEHPNRPLAGEIETKDHLKQVASFDVLGGIVTIFEDDRTDLSGSTLTTANLVKTIRDADRLSKENIVLDVNLAAGKDRLSLPVNLSLSPHFGHGFMILPDARAVEIAAKVNLPSGSQTPGLTVYDPHLKLQETYLSPTHGKFDSSFKGLDADAEVMGENVFGNILALEMTPKASHIAKQYFGHPLTAGEKFGLVELLNDSVAKSYGVALASQYAHKSYKEYRRLIANQYIHDTLTRIADVRLPYVQIPRQAWQLLGHKVSDPSA